MEGVRRLGWGIALSALLGALALAVPVAGIANGPRFETGAYTGRTGQGLRIFLSVGSRSIRSIEFGWRARCADGRKHSNTIAGGSARIRKDGTFSMGGVLNTGGRFHVEGKLRGRSAWGRLSRSGPSAFGTFDCTARNVKWKARLQGDERPTRYMGTTNQGLPISFTATATEVLALDFGWTALCADGQTHSNTISAGSGPIYEAGNFSLSGILNTGGAFLVSGTVTGDTASGQLSRSGPSAFGTFDCSVTGVTWQAQAVGR